MIRRLAVLLAMCTAIAHVSVPQHSRADIDADAGSANGIALCGQLYSAGHDPSGLWGRLNNPASPPIQIITTQVPPNGTGTKTHVEDDGSVQIFWDPTRDITKDGITATPCEALYHELQHAADDVDNNAGNGPDRDDSCNGIPQAEWRAVAAENAYRAGFGLPPRKSYNGKQFGSDNFDDCKKNQPPPGSPKKSSNSVFGDPHLTTTDGLLYDLQQVGEFTAFRSSDSTAPRVSDSNDAGSRVEGGIAGIRGGRGQRRPTDRVRQQGRCPDHHALDREQ